MCHGNAVSKALTVGNCRTNESVPPTPQVQGERTEEGDLWIKRVTKSISTNGKAQT